MPRLFFHVTWSVRGLGCGDAVLAVCDICYVVFPEGLKGEGLVVGFVEGCCVDVCLRLCLYRTVWT